MGAWCPKLYGVFLELTNPLMNGVRKALKINRAYFRTFFWVLPELYGLRPTLFLGFILLFLVWFSHMWVHVVPTVHILPPTPRWLHHIAPKRRKNTMVHHIAPKQKEKKFYITPCDHGLDWESERNEYTQASSFLLCQLSLLRTRLKYSEVRYILNLCKLSAIRVSHNK